MPSLPLAIAALNPAFVFVPSLSATRPGGGTPAAGDTIGTMADLSTSAHDAIAPTGHEAIFRGTAGGNGWAEFPSTDGGASIAGGGRYNVGPGHYVGPYYAALVRSRNDVAVSGRDRAFWNTYSAPVGVGEFGPTYSGSFAANGAAVSTGAGQAPRAVWRNGLDLSGTSPATFTDVSEWHIQEWSIADPTTAKAITLGWTTPGYVSAMDLAAVVCLGADPTDAQRLAVRRYLAGLVPWVNVNFFGNSRFSNVGTTDVGTNANTHTLATKVRDALPVADPARLWGVYQRGNPGNTTTQLIALRPIEVDPLVAADASADIVCLTEGFNEVGANWPDSGGSTDDQAAAGAFARLKSLGLAIKARGPKVLYGTEFSAVLPQRADWDIAGGVRAKLLALVLADPSWYDGLVRQDLIPGIGPVGTLSADGTHAYSGDGIHLNDNGNAVAEPCWTAAIRSMAAHAAQPPSPPASSPRRVVRWFPGLRSR